MMKVKYFYLNYCCDENILRIFPWSPMQWADQLAVQGPGYSDRGEVREGEVYLSLDMPALFTVDINGQMEDQDTGRLPNTGGFYEGRPIYTLTIFSNPTLSKSSLSDPGVHQVTPGQEVPLRVPGSLSTSSRASTRSDWTS